MSDIPESIIQAAYQTIAGVPAERGEVRRMVGVLYPYPNWGMGGGSQMEANAQDKWEAQFNGFDTVALKQIAIKVLLSDRKR